VRPDLLNASILMSPRHLGFGGCSCKFTGGAGNFTERQPPSAGIIIIQV